MSFRYPVVIAVIMALHAHQAHAGASLLIDDAAITPAGHCQMESWVRSYSPGHELTAVPACNVAGTEFGLGISHYTRPVSSNIWSIGIKHLFREFDAEHWGVGLSVGATQDDLPTRSTSWSANMPVSLTLDAESRVVLHANLGWAKSHSAPETATGGIGLDIPMTHAWTVIAEIYGDHHGTAGQLGLRRIVTERMSLDMLIGHQESLSSSPWLTLGLNISLPR